MRVLIFSHGHPNFSKGGGEYAAYYLYQGINATADHEAWLAARAEEKLLHRDTSIATLNDREYLIAGNAHITTLSTDIAIDQQSDFAYMLQTIQPEVVHFHHYVFLGLELIRAVKNICPKAKIVMTLHEYIAICMNNGQMIKTDGRLCYRYSPLECSQCFPKQSPENFFLRERYIKTFFELVDNFIAPSEFLRTRYVEWGLPANKIQVLENGLPTETKLPPRQLREHASRGRFAYFGQIHPYKGLDIILDAFAQLPKRIKKQVVLDIFGFGVERQSSQYQKKLKALLKTTQDCVHFHGAYEPSELAGLMRSIDWVVMGSIWWENSPLVIQEAFKLGRPVICPDIGGMAEKVRDGIDGIHYRARDSISLAHVIENIVSGEVDYQQLYAQLPEVTTIERCTVEHLSVYQQSG